MDKKRLHPSWQGNTKPKPKPERPSKRQDAGTHDTNRRGGKQK